MKYSPLQHIRYKYSPVLPVMLQKDISTLTPEYGKETESFGDQGKLKEIFPHTYGRPTVRFTSGESNPRTQPINIGVVLSGGQAPGGHNVIAGIFDAMKASNTDSRLFGFLDGPSGILENRAIELTEEYLDQFRNTGGFDIIGSGRTKIETEEQFGLSAEVLKKRDISALVIIGGDDSNTNAALLAEYFKKSETDITVIGVPKTIDGDLKNEDVEISFGFDTATKTYAEIIGNIGRDAKSAKKYWHFIRLMGRSASRICLECALRTQPNIAIMSEEIEREHTTLNEIVEHIVQTVVKRSEEGENFGVVLVPEGLIEFIPEVKNLIYELNTILAEHESYFNTLHTFEDQAEWINKKLSRDTSYVFSTLPNNIQRQLLMDRDPHGNVQVSRIETEKLLIEMTEDRLNELKSQDKFKGKFNTQHHFLGYEGRAAFPSNFDANYTYALGYNAYVLISFGLTGYITSIRNLSQPAEQWVPGGIPITMMMNLERRHGAMKPVIKKALVDLDDKPFKVFAAKRGEWALKTSYTYPGAIQYFGPEDVCNEPPMTIAIEQS
ncbi:MAG: diphosphate--fructose-6-phosphate 1-phosphotransferase [Sediminispirochaetaceae bacterium]